MLLKILPSGFLLCLLASQSFAQVDGRVDGGADGPDFYRVNNVAADDVLNMRSAPYWQAEKVGEIPPDGQCIKNMGCRGGLTYHEFVTLNKTDKEQLLRRRPRWCKVEYKGKIAWVAGRYLAEGHCSTLLDKRPLNSSKIK